jgi:hypothetical protein
MTWNQFLLLAQEQGGTVALVVFSGTGVGLIIKFWGPIVSFFKVVDAVKDLPETMSEIKTELLLIKREVLPNSGSSLRDSVNRTESEIAYIKGALGITKEEVKTKARQKVGTRG